MRVSHKLLKPIMVRKKRLAKYVKQEKNGKEQSDTKLVIVLITALILAILIILAIVMTSYNLFF